MSLFEALTKEDNKLIEKYIDKFGIPLEEYCGNQTFLRHWAKNKELLYKLLDNNLILKFKFPKENNTKVVNATIAKEICDNYFFDIVVRDYFSVYLIGKDNYKVRDIDNDFILTDEQAENILTAISKEAFVNNAIPEMIKIHIEGKKLLQLQKGTKVFSALQKIFKYFEVPSNFYQKLEYLRVKYAQLLSDRTVDNTYVCISIHPLDFFTLSDNNLDWHSCLSWIHDGCYKQGTIEMMNSDCVVCCYLEDSRTWNFNPSDTDSRWNNKRIRQLFYIKDTIILSGKPYPYSNDAFTLFVLRKLKELAEKNLDYTYEPQVQTYSDMNHIDLEELNYTNSSLDECINSGNTIFFETNGMFNDFANEFSNRLSDVKRTTIYYCFRKPIISHEIYNCSGPSTCLCCGGEVITPDDFEECSYNQRYNNVDKLICPDCEAKREPCDCCGARDKRIIKTEEGYYLCEECINELTRVCPCCGEKYLDYNKELEDSLLEDSSNKVFLRLKDDIFLEDILYYDIDFCREDVAIQVNLCEKCRKELIDKGEIKIISIKPRVARNYRGKVAPVNFMVSSKIGKESELYKYIQH